MRIEMERMRPLNMNKNDVNKAIFRDRAKAGSSLADVQPMEMDMGVTFDNVGGLKDQINALKVQRYSFDNEQYFFIKCFCSSKEPFF